MTVKTLFKSIFSGYFIVIGLLANLVIFSIVGVFATDKVTSHWRWGQFQRFIEGPIDNTEITFIRPVDTHEFNPHYTKLPKAQWIKIHQQKQDDNVIFKRQRHGGSAFDSKRGQLILYGSDTHGEDWGNTLKVFDMASVRWQPITPSPSPDSYSVTKDGIPVASEMPYTPWAMHTFDAIDYDPSNDQLIVASFPEHLKPGRFGNWLKTLWPKVKQHPTWVYNLSTHQWQYSRGKNTHFFPYATAFNPITQTLIGFRPDGVYEFIDLSKGWKRLIKTGPPGYHTNAIYDANNDIFIIFGNNSISNDIYTYQYGDIKITKMPTPGLRPGKTQHTPLAHYTAIGKTIALVDRKNENLADTWAYDAKKDEWKKIETATFPFKIGMNYNVQYDTKHQQLVLVAAPENEHTSVWVLRL